MRLYPKATRSDDGMASVARVYADVNENKPQEYWDYENYSIEWRYACVVVCHVLELDCKMVL